MLLYRDTLFYKKMTVLGVPCVYVNIVLYSTS